MTRFIGLFAAACLLVACPGDSDRPGSDPSQRVTDGNSREGTAYYPAMDEGNERRASKRAGDETSERHDTGDRDDVQRGPEAPTAPYGERGTAEGNTGESDDRNTGDADARDPDETETKNPTGGR